MGHKWISTDGGDQCYRCGMVLDYGARTEDGGVIDWTDPLTEAESSAAHWLTPDCTGPSTERAHHYVLAAHPTETPDAYFLECAYGDSATDEGRSGGPAVYDPECIGA